MFEDFNFNEVCVRSFILAGVPSSYVAVTLRGAVPRERDPLKTTVAPTKSCTRETDDQ